MTQSQTERDEDTQRMRAHAKKTKQTFHVNHPARVLPIREAELGSDEPLIEDEAPAVKPKRAARKAPAKKPAAKKRK